MKPKTIHPTTLSITSYSNKQSHQLPTDGNLLDTTLPLQTNHCNYLSHL